MIRTAVAFGLLLLLGGVRATESGPSGAAAVPPGPAHLVHDFFPGQFDGDKPLPQLTRLGGVLFFVASDRDTGYNVWRTDGTPAGTRRVPFAAPAGTVVGSGIVGILNGRMLLGASVAGDPPVGTLFAAGEQGEATLLHAFRSGPGAPAAPPIVGGRFYFQDCGEVRCEIWSTDGTPEGTAPVAALSSQPAEVHQDLLGTFADRWLLVAEGPSLVAYDGVTRRVLTLADWADATVYPVGESLFLLRADGLYVSSLAAPRAKLLFQAPGLASAGWHGDTFFFVPPNGRLWSTDGTSVSRYTGGYFESFSVLADRLGAIGGKTILPMPGYYGQALFGVDETSHQVSDIHWVCRGKYQCLFPRMSAATIVGDQALLAIDKRLWHSDGTPQGTRPLQPLILPDPSSFKALDGRLILGAQSQRGDLHLPWERQLWSTDGTAAGTTALSDGGRPFTVQGPAEPLGVALITAADREPVGQQIWRLANGRTAPLTALRHQATGINPQAVFPFGGGRLVLGGSLDWTGVTPEGITPNLRPEIDFCSADASPCLDVPVAVGGRLVFQEAGTAIFKSTDGTLAGRRSLPLEDADGVASVVASLGTFRDRSMILGNSGGLWTSDGTTAGTRFVTRLPPEPVTGSSGLPVVAPFRDGAASYLFRRVPDPDDDKLSALELWHTDGTAAGTVRMTSIPFDKEASPYPAPSLVGGKLFFRVLGVLWVSDGTPAGTRALPDQPPGGTFALAAGATLLYAGAGYQSTEVPTPPQTLWAIDPATLAATEVASFPRIGDGSPGTPLGDLMGDTLFFQTTNPGGVRRSRRTEGTPESTRLLPDFLAKRDAGGFVTAGGRRYFTACDAAHGCELWSTDRLGEDTRLVEDLFPGTRSSDPEILAVAGHTLWFAGVEPNVGRELWTLDLAAGALAPSWVRPAAPNSKRVREPLWKRMRR